MTTASDGASDAADSPALRGDRGRVPMRWRYRAADASGAAVNGEIDAATDREAIDALRRRSLWVTELTPASARVGDRIGDRISDRAGDRIGSDAGGASGVPNARGVVPWLSASRARLVRLPWARATSARDLAVVTRAMSTLLAAGVPLERALSFAVTQSPDDESRRAFTAVRDAVRNGQSMSSAISAHRLFPAYFAPTLVAGEASGTLDGSLQLLSDHLERSDAVRSRLTSALVYPAILGVATVVGVTVILLVVVPRFATLIAESGGALPLSTRALIAVSGLARFWWLALLATALAAYVWLQAMTNSGNRRRWHAARLAWPIVGRLERTRAAAEYTGTLAVALKSGVGLLSAMALSRGVVSNLELCNQLAEAERRVRDGGTLAGALDGVLPPLALRLLDAGEVTGDLASMASRAAEAADRDVQGAVSQAVTLLEPALILGFGGLVGFVALALLQAIYGINARTL